MPIVSPAHTSIKPPVHADVTTRLHALVRRAVTCGLDVATRAIAQSFLAWDRSAALFRLASDRLTMLREELLRARDLPILVAGWVLLLVVVELRGDEEEAQRLLEFAEADLRLAGV